MSNICGAIYILTNPSFPDYVKIGYSKNVEERINRLNNSAAVLLDLDCMQHMMLKQNQQIKYYTK